VLRRRGFGWTEDEAVWYKANVSEGGFGDRADWSKRTMKSMISFQILGNETVGAFSYARRQAGELAPQFGTEAVVKVGQGWPVPHVLDRPHSGSSGRGTIQERECLGGNWTGGRGGLSRGVTEKIQPNPSESNLMKLKGQASIRGAGGGGYEISRSVKCRFLDTANLEIRSLKFQTGVYIGTQIAMHVTSLC
jgi:hypothetical protein